VRIRDAVKPHDVLLVVDAMTGQDAVNVAESFAEAVQFDGVIMSKLDGDARGGAALSVKAVTGKPILFRLHRREARSVRTLSSRPHGSADPGHGRRAQPDREAEQQFDESDALALGAQAAPQRVRARRLPRPAEDGAQNGSADEHPWDDPRLRRPPAAEHEARTNASSTGSRRSSSR